jgi:hypothetical protein
LQGYGRAIQWVCWLCVHVQRCWHAGGQSTNCFASSCRSSATAYYTAILLDHTCACCRAWLYANPAVRLRAQSLCVLAGTPSACCAACRYCQSLHPRAKQTQLPLPLPAKPPPITAASSTLPAGSC